MDRTSFQEILRQKMGPTPTENHPSRSTANTDQQSVSEIFQELLFIRITPPLSVTFRGYPQPPARPFCPSKNTSKEGKKNFTPMEKKPEIWVKKSQLDEISQTKWVRFEKMVGQNLGDSLSKSMVLKTFRSFLKGIHPDTVGSKPGTSEASHNFATLVKIKNELVTALDSAAFTKACGT